MKKLLFIDTNVFINCVFQETEGLDCEPLNKILNKLEKNELNLIMPEIIEREIDNSLITSAIKLKDNIKKLFEGLSPKIPNNKTSKEKISRLITDSIKLITDSIKENENSCLEKIEKAKKEGLSILKKIISHKNTIKISLTNELILNGMRRALFKTPPFNTTTDKSSHTKDQDCIAFESLLFCLKQEDHTRDALITCIDDADYRIEKNSENLKIEIKEELLKFCKNIKSYRNPLEMLNKEFSTKYSEKDVKKYTFTSLTLPDTLMTGAFFQPASIINPFKVENGVYITPPTLKSVTELSHVNLGSINMPSSFEQIKTGQIQFCRYCGKENSLPNLGICNNCYQHLS